MHLHFSVYVSSTDFSVYWMEIFNIHHEDAGELGHCEIMHIDDVTKASCVVINKLLSLSTGCKYCNSLAASLGVKLQKPNYKS